MESVKKWLAERAVKKNGVFVHYSPPKSLGSVSGAQFRQWARGGAGSRLERAVLAGQGRRLLAEAEALPLANHLPALMAKCNALHVAVERGSLMELQELLYSEYSKRKYITCTDEAGVGLLHKAVYYDYMDIAAWLVSIYPPIVHQKDSEGRTPLHYAAMCRDEAAAASLLEGAGAARGSRDAAGKTPAFYRGPARDTLVLPIVSDMARDNRNHPPGLVLKRSNIRIWCHDCDMARLQRVVWEGHGSKLLSEVSNQPVVKKFLEAVPYMMNTIRDLHNAVVQNDIEGVMKHSGDPIPAVILSSRDANNMTVFYKAAGLGHGGILRYITERYPEGVNDVDNEGRTPLHYAAAVRDDHHTFNSLVSLGADESIVDNKNKTPAYYLNRPQEIDKNMLKVIPEAPRTPSSAYPSTWDWKLLDTEVIADLNKKSRRKNFKVSTENVSTNNTASESTDIPNGTMKTSSTQELIKDLPDLDDSSKSFKVISDENDDNLGVSKETEEEEHNQQPETIKEEEVENEQGNIVDTPQNVVNAEKINENEPEDVVDDEKINENEPENVVDDEKNNENDDTNAADNEEECKENEKKEDDSQDNTNQNEEKNEESESNTNDKNKEISTQENNKESESNHSETENDPEQDECTNVELENPDEDLTGNSEILKEAENLDENSKSLEGNHIKITNKDEDINNIDEQKEAETGETANEGNHKSDDEDDDDVQVQHESNSEYSNLKIAEAPTSASTNRDINRISSGIQTDGRSTQESLIEGIINGEVDMDSQDASISQSVESIEGDVPIGDNEIDPEVTELINSTNMEMLAALVLNGEGSRLVGRYSKNSELQSFLDNVPIYMKKIHKVHMAAREGNIRDLQAALDRRKFAIARDPISPNGATPLHVATVFGKTNIIKYLGGRFPETLSAVDFEGRTALHYAGVLPDNGHYYNLLQQLGANSKDLDDNGRSAEEYYRNKNLMSLEQLFSDFGITPDAMQDMLSDKVPEDCVSSRRSLDAPEAIDTLERCYRLLASARPTRTPLSASSNRATPPLVLGRFLRKSVFDAIKYRVTKLDHDLFDVIWPAVKKLPDNKNIVQIVEEDFTGGVTAPDYYVYTLYEEFLTPLIKDLHNINVHSDLKAHPVSDFARRKPLSGSTVNSESLVELNIDPNDNFVLSGTMECMRNIIDFELPLNLSVRQLEEVERIITTVLMQDEFSKFNEQSSPESDQRGGTYYTLSEVLEKPSEVSATLASAGLLITLCEKSEIDDCERLHGKHWPYGRGVYVSDDKTVAIWINVHDHLRVLTATPTDAPGEIGLPFSPSDPNGHMDIPAFKTDEGRYLAKSLGDPLIKGLTEVANVKPKDPIAFLASFLHNFPDQEKPRLGTQESNVLVTHEAAEVENEVAPPQAASTLRTRTSTKKPDRPIEVITVDPKPEPSPDAPEQAFSSINRDEHGQSMLHFAAARSHSRNALFQLLQESDINLAYRDELYRTARDVSIQANVPENTTEIDRWVLHLAARGNSEKIMELLLEGYDHILDVVDEEGVPISEVISQRDLGDMSSLLASIPAFEDSREALHAAIRRADLASMKSAITAEGGRTLARGKNSYGRTALHVAVLAQHEDLVAYLAENCPELLRIGDNLERTPLHYAMGVEKMESLSRVLIRAGSKRVLKDLKGRQPSYYFMNKSDILRLKEEEEVY